MFAGICFAFGNQDITATFEAIYPLNRTVFHILLTDRIRKRGVFIFCKWYINTFPGASGLHPTLSLALKITGLPCLHLFCKHSKTGAS